MLLFLAVNPITCNFQYGACGYYGYNWYRKNGTTPTSYTGPTHDFDTGQFNKIIQPYKGPGLHTTIKASAMKLLIAMNMKRCIEIHQTFCF